MERGVSLIRRGGKLYAAVSSQNVVSGFSRFHVRRGWREVVANDNNNDVEGNEARNPRVSLTLMLISNVKRVLFRPKVHFHPVKRRHAFFVSGIAPQEKRDEKEKREKEQKESLIVFEGVGIREARISRTIF